MLKRQLLRCSIALFLAFASSMTLSAHGIVWRFLGGTRIGKGQDHERIRIDDQQGPFRAVQLRVRGDAIFCQRVVVTYRNGSSEVLAIGGRLSSEGNTRIIDLAGEGRTLQSVELWYFSEPWENAPHVILYGTR